MSSRNLAIVEQFDIDEGHFEIEFKTAVYTVHTLGKSRIRLGERICASAILRGWGEGGNTKKEKSESRDEGEMIS